jgi:hypothetical protein
MTRPTARTGIATPGFSPAADAPDSVLFPILGSASSSIAVASEDRFVAAVARVDAHISGRAVVAEDDLDLDDPASNAEVAG